MFLWVFGVAEHEPDIIFSIWGIFTKICHFYHENKMSTFTNMEKYTFICKKTTKPLQKCIEWYRFQSRKRFQMY